jgi:glycosyltransferase involved in cell wall biosynthesis
MTAFRVVTLRTPDFDGTGDARRAASIVAALKETGTEVRITSLLRSGDGLLRAMRSPLALASVARTVIKNLRTMPLQVSLIDALFRHRRMIRVGPDEIAIFITSRVAPISLPENFVVDFVDSMGSSYAQRSAKARGLAWLWRRESKLLAAWESRLASTARVSVSVSESEAKTIHQNVGWVPIEMTKRDCVAIPAHENLTKEAIIFAGSLHYYPNDEAARWIIEQLLPELLQRGWSADRVVIAGRRPTHRLRKLVDRSGVTLHPDVPDLELEFANAAISLAPIVLGSGVQGKVVDSLAAGTPVVMTPRANRGFDLRDSSMTRICERSPVDFADAVDQLLGESRYEVPVPNDVRLLLEQSEASGVQKIWRELLLPCLEDAALYNADAIPAQDVAGSDALQTGCAHPVGD